jgi:hypothetical protein
VAYSRNDAKGPSRKFLDKDTEAFFRSIIDPVPYSVFGCLSFASTVNGAQAVECFRDLIQQVSANSVLKDNIGYMLSTERKWSGRFADGIRLHLHFIAISHGPLSDELISHFWSNSVGNCEVEKYNHKLKGIGYILKMRDCDGCDWTISDNFYLFQPDYVPSNKRQRQRFKRQALRDAERSSRLHEVDLPVAAPMTPGDALVCSLAQAYWSGRKNRTPERSGKEIILDAIDEYLDELVHVRALLTGEPVPSKRRRSNR